MNPAAFDEQQWPRVLRETEPDSVVLRVSEIRVGGVDARLCVKASVGFYLDSPAPGPVGKGPEAHRFCCGNRSRTHHLVHRSAESGTSAEIVCHHEASERNLRSVVEDVLNQSELDQTDRRSALGILDGEKVTDVLLAKALTPIFGHVSDEITALPTHHPIEIGKETEPKALHVHDIMRLPAYRV